LGLIAYHSEKRRELRRIVNVCHDEIQLCEQAFELINAVPKVEEVQGDGDKTSSTSI
jgi:hypothetical protein